MRTREARWMTSKKEVQTLKLKVTGLEGELAE